MADLITCADVAKYNPKISIANTTVKAAVQSLITQVSAGVEKWCDRTFAATTYQQWYDGTGTRFLKLDQYPVTRLYQVSCGTQDIIRLSYTGADVEAFASCDGVALTLVNGTTITDITLSDNATATALASSIADVTGWGASIFSGMDNYPPSKIRPFNSYAKGAGNEVDVVIPDEAMDARVADRSEWLIEGGFPCGSSNVFVWYKAGYALIPEDLKHVVARIVSDAYRVSKRDTTMKGEKLGDYSYTAGGGADGVSLQNLIGNYSDALIRYKRVEMA